MGDKEISAIISLLQSVIWPLFITFILYWLRRNYSEQLSNLFEAVRKRIEQGSSLKFGPVELGELKELKASVQQTQNFVDDLKAKYTSLEDAYLATADTFEPDAPVFDLDELASQLKALASALPNLDFLKDIAVPGIAQPDLFALSCALQVRPHVDFAVPLASILESIAEKTNLSDFRLRTLYRTIIAIDSIVRVDNRQSDKALGAYDRSRINAALTTFRASPRCAEDYDKYKDKSIVARIDRVLKLL